MNRKAQWILKEEEIQEFERQRVEHYRQFQYPTGRDSTFNQGEIARFVQYMRRKRRQHEDPFKFEKIIFYAVTLYKRYYLVNSFICEDITFSQAIICCTYLSLKFNEYDDAFMLKAASKWRKKFIVSSKDYLPHFGDDGYSHAELKFLSGIKFQTGLSKVITPIEAMFHAITKGVNANKEALGHGECFDDKYGLCPSIEKYLTRLYEHPTVIFLFEGPQIAFSIMVAVLKAKKLSLELLGKGL